MTHYSILTPSLGLWHTDRKVSTTIDHGLCATDHGAASLFLSFRIPIAIGILNDNDKGQSCLSFNPVNHD